MNLFNSIKVNKPKRNLFNLSHESKLTADIGELLPFMVEMGYPGDVHKVTSEMLVKTMPMLAPIMHRVNVYQHFFFVPLRLIVPNSEEILTGGKDGTSRRQFPFLNISLPWKEYNGHFGKGSLADYLGFPTPTPNSSGIYGQQLLHMQIPAYLYNAYNLIYNEYYRDETLSEEVPLFMQTTDININSQTITKREIDFPCTIKYRAFSKDYFTSSLPFAQRGPQVNLNGNGSVSFSNNSTVPQQILRTNGSGPVSGSDGLVTKNGQLYTASGEQVSLNVSNSLDGSVANQNITINDLRQASRLQQWFERNARGGYRYIEQIFSHFGVKSSDARLQRPEYLGGCRVPVVVSEVLQQSQGTSDSPLGQQSGHAVSVNQQKGFKVRLEEHGIIMGILSIVPRAGYFQGVPRKFMFRDRFEMFWPEFGHLGEQPVYNDEIYHNFTNDELNNREFGYQSAYSYLKHNPDQVHGEFRDPQGLMYWHLARFFEPEQKDQTGYENFTVNLNESFLKIKPNSFDRIWPVETDVQRGHFYIQIYNNHRALRPMPRYGTPSI